MILDQIRLRGSPACCASLYIGMHFLIHPYDGTMAKHYLKTGCYMPDAKDVTTREYCNMWVKHYTTRRCISINTEDDKIWDSPCQLHTIHYIPRLVLCSRSDPCCANGLDSSRTLDSRGTQWPARKRTSCWTWM